MLSTFALAATLVAGAPPVVPLPTELEVCILKAEICTLEGRLPTCGGPTDLDECLSDYETCSYDFDEAHEPSCRLSYVWCKLEQFNGTPEWLAHCDEVYATCPTL